LSRYSDADHALALAGVFQGARMTFELARLGHTDEKMLQAGVATLFVTHPRTVAEVYGSPTALEMGLRHFIFQLSSPQDRNPEVTRYSIRLLQLGQQLHKQPQRLQALGEALDNFQSRADAFEFDAETRYRQLAEIYREFISPLPPRILVQGDPVRLRDERIAARIRAALLSGVRSAHLWYQCGGRRWHLITRHRRLLAAARELLESVPSEI